MMKNELKVMMAMELLDGFIAAHTKEDQQTLALVGAYALSNNFKGIAIVNLSRNRTYNIFRDDTSISLRNSGGRVYTFPIVPARKFIAALGAYAETDFTDTEARYTYRNKMVSAIAG